MIFWANDRLDQEFWFPDLSSVACVFSLIFFLFRWRGFFLFLSRKIILSAFVNLLVSCVILMPLPHYRHKEFSGRKWPRLLLSGPQKKRQRRRKRRLFSTSLSHISPSFSYLMLGWVLWFFLFFHFVVSPLLSFPQYVPFWTLSLCPSHCEQDPSLFSVKAPPTGKLSYCWFRC